MKELPGRGEVSGIEGVEATRTPNRHEAAEARAYERLLTLGDATSTGRIQRLLKLISFVNSLVEDVLSKSIRIPSLLHHQLALFDALLQEIRVLR